MRDAFAVTPDSSSSPSAVFRTLEEAIDWGLVRYGSDAFSIRGVVLAPIEAKAPEGRPGAAS
jgi:hypothetical protein